MKEGEGITFFIPHRIGILAAEAYLSEVIHRGADCHVVCPADIAPQLIESVPEIAGRISPLETLTKSRRSIQRLHTWITVLLEAKGEHHNPRIAARRTAVRRPWRMRIGDLLSRFTPKLRTRTLNNLLGRALSLFLTNPFPTRRIVVVSHPSTPFLLCARKQEVHTIMESWDHPIKKSAGYPSRSIVAWNDDLAKDWQLHQGARQAIVGYPMKLRYALESTLDPHRTAGAGPPTALYAVGTTALRSHWYSDELRLIEEVCRATAAANWRLIIKPKPNGLQPGLEELSARFGHVTLGTSTNSSAALDYYLDEAYNQRRLEELSRCRLVINTVTTFCLDAACAGWPVLQIDVSGSDEYPLLAEAMRNYHLRTYIANEPELCLRPNPDLCTSLQAFLEEPDSRPFLFRDKLRQWLLTSSTCDEAVDRVVDHLLAPQAAQR